MSVTGQGMAHPALVQEVVREVLEGAVYEQDFLDCSFGFSEPRRVIAP